MTRAAVETALDHAVVLVDDLDAAGRDWERAGFTVMPKTLHSAEMGTANRCIMLATTYVELLAIEQPTDRNAGWRDLLADGQGLKGLALRTGDIEATEGMLATAGIPAGPAVSFSRETDEGTLRFSILRIDRAATPGLQVIVCRHWTPDLVWTPASTSHANRGHDIAGLSVPCPDPAAVADLLGRAGSSDGNPTPVELSHAGTGAGPGRIAITVDDPARVGAIDLARSCGIVLDLVAR